MIEAPEINLVYALTDGDLHSKGGIRCRDTSHCSPVFTPLVSSVAFINGFEPVATNG